MKYAACLLCLLVLAGCQGERGERVASPGAALGGEAEQGFARADAPREFSFPRDHHAHPAYRNEWWYITGNLRDAQGRRYGYQLTLFRIALRPQAPQSPSAWATNQLWMGHVALTDVQAQRHRHASRLSRGALGLAGQHGEPFRVWLEDWQIKADGRGELPWQIEVATSEFAFELQLEPLKPAVLQGEAGLSQKSAEAGNASYYYSLTRLKTTGRIRQDGRWLEVEGLSWLDREWSTSALGPDQTGWDWFSLQLDDGHDLMFYRLRNRDGSVDPHSKGAWVDPQGEKRTLYNNDVTLEPLRYWQSQGGGRYPVKWRMQVPAVGRSFVVEALVDDQLMDVGVIYWEGAVRVSAADTGQTLGHGYLEMTGY